MKEFALLSFVLLILGAVLGVLYWRFQQTDAVRWVRRLDKHVFGLNCRCGQLLLPVNCSEIDGLEADHVLVQSPHPPDRVSLLKSLVKNAEDCPKDQEHE